MTDIAVRRIVSDALTGTEHAALRSLFASVWSKDEFTGDDWDHAQGGMHFVVEMDGDIVSHAAVVPRELHACGHVLRTGYVEAMATHPLYRRKGFASALLRDLGAFLDAHYALGGLDTGKLAFYARHGWQSWRGPTYVRTAEGIVRTPEEDGCVMVRRTPATPDIDLAAPISCDWRSGDVW